MPRLTKIIANISDEKIYDGVSGSQLSTNSFPYTSAKELSQLEIQYVTAYTSLTEKTDYTGFAGQTISSSAVIDNDYNHVDKGVLATSLSVGAITEIEIIATTLDNIPQSTGVIQLINAGSQSETVAYTGVTLIGLNYVFVVSETLTYAYNAGSQANTNDPPLVKSTTVDTSGKDTGLFVIDIDTNTQPYLLEVEGKAKITGCIFEQQIRDDLGQKIFEFQLTFVCNNSLDDDGALPPPVGFDFYTKLEVDALLAGYLPRQASNVDIGALLNADDYFPVWNKDDGLAERYKISDIALGTQVAPTQNVYADIATMLADQGSQSEDYLQQAGTVFYKKDSASTADISDYIAVSQAPIEGLYANTTAMIADQANQNANYLEKAGDEYYHYLGTTVGDITDYQLIGSGGSGSTDDLGLDTGVIDGLAVTVNADNTKVDISAGKIFIRDYMTDPENPIHKECTLDADIIGLTVDSLNSATYTQFVAVEDLPSNAGKVRIEQLADTEGEIEYYKDKAKLQVAIHFDQATVAFTTGSKWLAYNKVNDLVKYTVAHGAVVKGVKITDNGADDLSCTQTAGTAVAVDINAVADTRNSSGKSFTEQQATMFYNYKTDSSTFVYEVNSTTVIKPNFWNDLSTNTVEAVPAGKFTIQRCFFFPASNTLGVAYGQHLYDYQAEAIADIQNGFEEAPTFEDAVLITSIICKSGATSTKSQADILFAQAKTTSFDTGLTNISINPGFIDVDTSEFSHVDGTQTLTLSPIAPATTIKVKLFSGQIIERSSFTWVHADVEAVIFFYIDDAGDEQTSVAPSKESTYNLMKSTIPCSFIDWGDSSFQKANTITDIRKQSNGMSPETMAKNFFDIPIYSLDGVKVTDFPVNPTGDFATDLQFGFATDELLIIDRQFDLPAFSRGDTWRVMYMDGANVRHIDKPLYAFATGFDFGQAEDRPCYNNDGTPSFVDPPNNNKERYCYYFMSIVNDIDPTKRMVAWMGNNEYTSTSNASDGLADEIARIKSIARLSQQTLNMYAVLYEVNNGFDNDIEAVALSIQKITTDLSVGGSSSLPSGLVDGSNADSLHKHEMQALQTSTSGVNDTAGTVCIANGSGVTEKHVVTGNDKYFGTDSGGNRGVYDLPSGGGTTEEMIVSYQTASGVAPVNAVTGVWTKFPLNTTDQNSITGASMTTSVITLPAGTYSLVGQLTQWNNLYTTVRLRNTTDALSEIIGGNSLTIGFLNGRNTFTLSATKNIEIQYYTQNASTEIGMTTGEVNVHGSFSIQKIG